MRHEWVREANLTEDSGYRAMREILGEKRQPSAIFAGNDVVAYGAIQAIKEAGLSIPSDISVFGFDDDLLSRYLNPPLSTVTNPASGLGAEAARLLISILRGRTVPSTRTALPTALALRESCKAL
jgi:LacI family transcriptional regulator